MKTQKNLKWRVWWWFIFFTVLPQTTLNRSRCLSSHLGTLVVAFVTSLLVSQHIIRRERWRKSNGKKIEGVYRRFWLTIGKRREMIIFSSLLFPFEMSCFFEAAGEVAKNPNHYAKLSFSNIFAAYNQISLQ